MDKKDGALNKSVIDRNTHDIKNQLMMIMSMTNNIKDTTHNNDIKKYAYFIKEAVYSCRYMIDNINIDIHEIKAENNKLMNMHYVLSSLQESFCSEKGIVFMDQMKAENPRIYANKVIINNAIYNILVNAIEEIEYSGTIIIKTYNHTNNPNSKFNCSQWLCIEIADSGRGINDECRGKIFDECFTTKKNKKGIGLYSAKRAVEKHKGTINVKSTKGKGATFIICLPCHVE